VPLVVHAGRIIAVADLWLDGAYRSQGEGAAGRGRFRWRRGAAPHDADESSEPHDKIESSDDSD
jgi:hypothetical protein